jgi:hypothetical protein
VTADPTRRVVLAATAALPFLVTGCKGVAALESIPRPPRDVVLLRAAISAEQLMIARYEAVIAMLRGGSGGLPSVLLPLLGQHRQHLAQLRSRLIVPAGAAPAASPGRSSPSSRPPPAPALAIAYLQAAEQDASARLLDQLLAAPTSLAELLASIAASEATHVPVLEAAGRPG